MKLKLLRKNAKIIKFLNLQNHDYIKDLKHITFYKSYSCLLSPLKDIPGTMFIHFSMCPNTYKERNIYLREKRDASIKLESQLDLIELWFAKEQKYRFIFLKLLQRMIYHKYKNRLLNTEDPVTLMTPKKPIYVFDIKQRGTYVFEASCLKKHIESELTYSEWLFPLGKHPKNPLTNLEFTETQRLSILQNIRGLNYGSWSFEAYRELKWNLIQFKTQYHIPLKLVALNDLVNNTSSDETIIYLQEFIDKNFYIHPSICNYADILFFVKWGVEHAMYTDYMKKWLQLYKKWYTYVIKYSVDEEYLSDNDFLFKKDIENQSYILFGDDTSITNLSKMYYNKQNSQLQIYYQYESVYAPAEDDSGTQTTDVTLIYVDESDLVETQNTSATTIQRAYREYRLLHPRS
jgi:hypothetical protein